LITLPDLPLVVRAGQLELVTERGIADGAEASCPADVRAPDLDGAAAGWWMGGSRTLAQWTSVGAADRGRRT
jgi:hypothetical protein